MERKFEQELLGWKSAVPRKPLVVVGARQIGKTTTIKAFGKSAFARCIHADLYKRPELRTAFAANLEPRAIITTLSAILREDIDPAHDLLFLDEIQESPEALASLKYFATDMPELAVVAAGSTLGVQIARKGASFPVGYVDMRRMNPMDFEEFCWAMGDRRAYELVRNSLQAMSACPIHEMMMGRYREYLLVGGMPEAVLRWVQTSSLETVRKVQDDIRMGYVADMAKYAENVDAVKIVACWESIPAQLAKESGSTKFVWKEISARAKAETHRSAIDWLAAARVIDRVTKVECMEAPLKTFEQDGSFKVYLADTGLLSAAYEATPADLAGKGPRTARFRGGLAENYVAQQLTAAGIPHYYWGMESRSEVEFVVGLSDGVVPIEVKSGENVRSVSLAKACDKYACPMAIRISAKNFGYENGILCLPLYAAGLVGEYREDLGI